jgi:Fur family transcriptional regulator, ferric uptake regulator
VPRGPSASLERSRGEVPITQSQGTRTRSTRQGAAVVAALSAMTAFGDARDVHEAVLMAGCKVGLATVYRHLRLLAEGDLVDTVRGPEGQILYRWRHDDHVRHLTCRVCGRVVEVGAREVWEWGREVASREGFSLSWVAVELTGVCADHPPARRCPPGRQQDA